jgi:hypothetical protein
MGRTHTQHTTLEANRRTVRHRRRTRSVGVAVAALTVLAACGGDDNDSLGAEQLADQDATASAPAAMDDSLADDAGFVETAATTPESPDATARSGGNGGIDLGSIGRDVIVEMHVVVSSDDIERSVAAITAEAAALGGGIASSDVDYGDRNPSDPTAPPDGHAVLVVKVPPNEVNRLIEGLDATGTVESINQSAQDVTEQLVDLEVRIANARQSVANVRAFMDQATNLNELVALESELTRRQTELEQLEAQQRNMGERVALATITIEVVPTAAVPEPIAEPDETDSVGEAFGQGWDAFATFVLGIAFVLAVLAPFIVLFAIGGAVALWVVRRRRRLLDGPPADRPTDQPAREPLPTPDPATVVNEPVGAGASRQE